MCGAVGTVGGGARKGGATGVCDAGVTYAGSPPPTFGSVPVACGNSDCNADAKVDGSEVAVATALSSALGAVPKDVDGESPYNR